MVSKKKYLIDFLISLILVIKNFFSLIFYPYKTMRKISLEKDFRQIFFIFLLVFCYFKFVYFLKDNPYPAIFTFFVFFINFFLMTGFFYFLAKILKYEIKFVSLIFTFSYSIFPTLIWFFSTSFFYLVLPPPRTTSFLGKLFSIFFITYSLSLLFWKIILFYLSLRFSTKQNFYRIIYMTLIFLLWFTPYSIFLYHFKIFRIPFI